MKKTRGSINKIEQYKIKSKHSLKMELMDIPFLVIGGLTSYEIIEFVSVSISGKVIPSF
ncbi:MAG: hypothetical protein KGI19_10840 [Thaumarchaeota archaeon]|nr:hypothetical protein [Nitrososphaerota archaeon]